MAPSINQYELIEQCKAGDIQAFEKLVDLYERDAYNIAYRFIGNHEDACDISQEAFIRVYRGIKGFKGKASFRTWLYRIIANLCYDELRKRRHPVTSIERSDGTSMYHEIPDPGPGPEDRMESMELQEVLQQALSGLSEGHRMIIILRDIEGLSYGEIGKILGIPMGTVKSRISRARAELKVALSERVRGVEGGL